MGGGHEKARNLREQEPGRDNRRATAAGIPNISRRPGARHKGGAYLVQPSAGEPFPVIVSGRIGWALEQLRRAGARGCTPIDNPAPRWSAYVFSLRGMGVEIETLREPHEGDFPGHHGRYCLRSHVTRAEGGAA